MSELKCCKNIFSCRKNENISFLLPFEAWCWLYALFIVHHTSSLLSHLTISPKYEISKANTKFFRNSGQFSCRRLRRQSSPSLWYVFHQIRATIASNPPFHRKSTVRFFTSWKPQNHSGANQMTDPWPQTLTGDPRLDVDGKGFLPRMRYRHQVIQGYRHIHGHTDPDTSLKHGSKDFLILVFL